MGKYRRRKSYEQEESWISNKETISITIIIVVAITCAILKFSNTENMEFKEFLYVIAKWVTIETIVLSLISLATAAYAYFISGNEIVLKTAYKFIIAFIIINITANLIIDRLATLLDANPFK